MKLKSRVERLETESGADGIAVWAHVPASIPEEEAETAVRKAAVAIGIAEPYSVIAEPSDQHTKIEINYAGGLDELFREISRSSTRIGGVNRCLVAASR